MHRAGHARPRCIGQACGFLLHHRGYARHLDILLGIIGVRRVHLVTHDLGGPWGLAWAASRPQDLLSLTLVSIGALPGYRWHRFAQLLPPPVIGELVLATAGRLATRAPLQRGGLRPVPEWFVDDIVFEYRDPALGARCLPSTAPPQTSARPRSLLRRPCARRTANARHLGRRRSLRSRPLCRDAHQFFPRAKVVVLPHCSHWPLVDDPDAVIGAVVPFLRGLLTSRIWRAGRGPSVSGSGPGPETGVDLFAVVFLVLGELGQDVGGVGVADRRETAQLIKVFSLARELDECPRRPCCHAARRRSSSRSPRSPASSTSWAMAS